MSTQYEQAYHWHPSAFGAFPDEVARFQKSAALVPSDAQSLLDLGCGNGYFLHTLEMHRPEMELCGVEPAEAAIEAKCCAAPIERGSATALSFSDGAFDVVTALEVIEHLSVSDYPTFLAEMARVARKALIVSVPFEERRIQVICPACDAAFNPNGHVRSFFRSDLEKLFPTFHLRHLETLGQGDRFRFGLPAYRIARKLLGSNGFPPLTVCPQCQYQEPPNLPPEAYWENQAKRQQKRGFFRQLLFAPCPKWYIAVYKK